MKLFKKYMMLPLVSLFLFVTNVSAQIEFPEDKVNWKFTIEQNGSDAVIVGLATVLFGSKDNVPKSL
mgnify:CR=1 FL=1